MEESADIRSLGWLWVAAAAIATAGCAKGTHTPTGENAAGDPGSYAGAGSGGSGSGGGSTSSGTGAAGTGGGGTTSEHVERISCGVQHSCVLTPAGGVKCWGNNQEGQLGVDSTANSLVPLDVVGLEAGVAKVSAGHMHTCALTLGGSLWCWGSNADHQLGAGAAVAQSLVPVEVVAVGSDVVDASAARGYHTCVVVGGRAKCWGANWWGQLGNDSTMDATLPVDVHGLAMGTSRVSAGGDHTCAMTTDHTVKCWGRNVHGDLGNGSTVDSPVPVDVVGLAPNVVAVAAGGGHTCVLTEGGGVRCWGRNEKGQLGDGSVENRLLPVDVVGLGSGVVAVNTGHHSCAVLEGGGVQCWGYNGFGQIGDGTTTDTAVPVDVLGIGSGAIDVCIGAAHSCAMLSSGAVKCWGANGAGQLGDGSIVDSPVPVDVVGL